MPGDFNFEGTAEVALGLLAAILIIVGVVSSNTTIFVVGLVFGVFLALVVLIKFLTED